MSTRIKPKDLRNIPLLKMDYGKNLAKVAAYAKIIGKRISSGFYTLKRNPLGRVRVWNLFYLIMKSVNTPLDGWVCCNKCKYVTIFDRKNYAFINKHACYLEMMVNKTEEDVTINFADSSVQNEQTNAHDMSRNGAQQNAENVENEAVALVSGMQEDDSVHDEVMPEISSQNLNEINDVNSTSTVDTNNGDDHTFETGATITTRSADTTPPTTNSVTSTTCTEIDENHIQEAKELFKSWIVENCRPLSILDDRNLKEIWLFAARLGKQYGEEIPIQGLIPSSKMLSEEIQKLAIIEKSHNKALIKNMKIAAMTFTYWDDSYAKSSFLAITLHYEKDSNLAYIVLGVKSIREYKDLFVYMPQKLSKLFLEYGISNYEALPILINNNEIFERVLENNTTINCSCKMLSTVLNSAIEETNELIELSNSCKELKKNFKDGDLETLSESQIKMNCNENWFDYYVMFDVICENWAILQNFQNENPIDIAEIRDLIELIKNFETIYNTLQNTNSPTLCFVIPAIKKINEICKSTTGNQYKTIEAFKANIAKNVSIHWENRLNAYHKVALFLFPPAIQTQKYFINDLKEVCIEMIKKQATPNIQCENLIEQRPKKMAEMKFFFPSLEIASNEQPETIEEEIERYLLERFFLANSNVLYWWNMNKTYYPRLSKLALSVLAIPASCSASEHLKHLAGNILTGTTKNFQNKQVENIILCSPKSLLST